MIAVLVQILKPPSLKQPSSKTETWTTQTFPRPSIRLYRSSSMNINSVPRCSCCVKGSLPLNEVLESLPGIPRNFFLQKGTSRSNSQANGLNSNTRRWMMDIVESDREFKNYGSKYFTRIVVSNRATRLQNPNLYYCGRYQNLIISMIHND